MNVKAISSQSGHCFAGNAICLLPLAAHLFQQMEAPATAQIAALAAAVNDCLSLICVETYCGEGNVSPRPRIA